MRVRTSGDEQAGFTLVELMMSLVIFSVAVAGILSVAVSLTQGFREQRQAVNAQDAARAPLEIIADAVRQASPGVSDPTKVYDTNTCTTGAISVINSTSVSDTLDVIYASGGIVTSLAAGPITQASATATVSENKNFASGDYVLITNFTTGHVVKLNNRTTGTTIGFGAPACGGGVYDFSYAAGSLVIRVQHARFTVANDTNNNNMTTVWMDPDSTATAFNAEPLAEGIEDMQIAVGIDADSNLTLTDASSSTDEWRYNNASDTAVSATDVIRAVRITMIARTTSAQHGNLGTYQKPTAEDRTTASSMDQFRRRVLKQQIDIRNVTGSP